MAGPAARRHGVGFDPAPASDPAAEAEIASVMRLVTEVRRFRSDQGLRPGQQVPAALTGLAGSALAGHEGSIRALLRLSAPGAGSSGPTTSVVAENVTVELDTAGVIDVAAERRRMEKDLAAARAEAEQAQRKLANESFLAKAPAEVVAKNRDRLDAAPRRHRPPHRAPGCPATGRRLNAELQQVEREIYARRRSTRSCRRSTGSPRWPRCSAIPSGRTR